MNSQSSLSPGISTTLGNDTPPQPPSSTPLILRPRADNGTPDSEQNDEGSGRGKSQWKGSWDDGEASSKRRAWYSTLLKRSCQIWKTVQQDHNDREIFI